MPANSFYHDLNPLRIDFWTDQSHFVRWRHIVTMMLLPVKNYTQCHVWHYVLIQNL